MPDTNPAMGFRIPTPELERRVQGGGPSAFPATPQTTEIRRRRRSPMRAWDTRPLSAPPPGSVQGARVACGEGSPSLALRPSPGARCFADGDAAHTLVGARPSDGADRQHPHRLLSTLCAQGLLCRDGKRRAVLPGPLLAEFSRAPLRCWRRASPKSAICCAELAERTARER